MVGNGRLAAEGLVRGRSEPSRAGVGRPAFGGRHRPPTRRGRCVAARLCVTRRTVSRRAAPRTGRGGGEAGGGVVSRLGGRFNGQRSGRRRFPEGPVVGGRGSAAAAGAGPRAPPDAACGLAGAGQSRSCAVGSPACSTSTCCSRRSLNATTVPAAGSGPVRKPQSGRCMDLSGAQHPVGCLRDRTIRGNSDQLARCRCAVMLSWSEVGPGIPNILADMGTLALSRQQFIRGIVLHSGLALLPPEDGTSGWPSGHSGGYPSP